MRKSRMYVHIFRFYDVINSAIAELMTCDAKVLNHYKSLTKPKVGCMLKTIPEPVWAGGSGVSRVADLFRRCRMAQTFPILSGPSLWDLHLALFDAKAKTWGRMVTFVVPGPHKTSKKQEFSGQVRNVGLTDDPEKFIISGVGGFPAVSPYWEQGEMGASEDTFQATFNIRTRKGEIEVIEGKGWKDVPIKGTITLDVFGEKLPEKMVGIMIRSFSEDLEPRIVTAIGRIVREENIPGGPPGLEHRVRGGVQLRIPLEHVENVVRVLEQRLQEHEFLRGTTVKTKWYESALSLIREPK